MATRRRKIARSAVRRVKRRESKNAKLRSLRSRKNARKYSTAKNKRINLREMRGGVNVVNGVEVKVVAGKDNFFTIYEVKDIGILFYNHKTKNFYLFIQEYHNDDYVIKFITWLCGFNGSLSDKHWLYPGSISNPNPYNFKYYLTFDSSKKKLYSVEYISARKGGIVMDGDYDSHVAGSDEQITKHELNTAPLENLNVPPTDNNENEVTSDGINFTLVKAFGNETLETDYFSEKWLDIRDKAKLKTALERAYEVSNPIIDALMEDTKN